MTRPKKSFDPSQYLISLPEYRKDPATGEWLEKEAQYLPVSARIAWFRSEHPNWTIQTKPIELTDSTAIFQAEIKNTRGKLIATGTALSSQKNFRKHLEKAETAAVGRALAFCGYGTLFTLEIAEEEIVDTPTPANLSISHSLNRPETTPYRCQSCGKSISFEVMDYSRRNFRNRLLCIPCQKSQTKTRSGDL